MGRTGGLLALVMCATLAGCGGAAEAAPTDASPDDFCAAMGWLKTEGVDRLSGGEFPPPEEDLAELMRDWSVRLLEVGTPDNMSDDAREGWVRFVERIDDLEAGDLDTMGWGIGDDPDGEAESSFRNYFTNSC